MRRRRVGWQDRIVYGWLVTALLLAVAGSVVVVAVGRSWLG